VFFGHSAKSFPSARQKTLDKDSLPLKILPSALCRVFSCLAHGKDPVPGSATTRTPQEAVKYGL